MFHIVNPAGDTETSLGSERKDRVKREVMAEAVAHIQKDIESNQYEMTNRILFLSTLPADICDIDSETHDLMCVKAPCIEHIDEYLSHVVIADCYSDVEAMCGDTYGFDVYIPPISPHGVLSSFVMIPDGADDGYYSTVETFVLKSLTLASPTPSDGDLSVKSIVTATAEAIAKALGADSFSDAVDTIGGCDHGLVVRWRDVLQPRSKSLGNMVRRLAEEPGCGAWKAVDVPGDVVDISGIHVYLESEKRSFILSSSRPTMDTPTFYRICNEKLMTLRFNAANSEYKTLRDTFIRSMNELKNE